jgi:hypothetical protein
MRFALEVTQKERSPEENETSVAIGEEIANKLIDSSGECGLEFGRHDSCYPFQRIQY